ncbi:HAD family phosphatase [Kineothrix sp. MSJ-39]|uniref:HAD family hydrolase n=1 Tax=Kineothrix sp. MSJ-39 TaxID=2841533 RepID=UPI001C1048CF|nr:HAD family phosphatase [Kineothrix sp. MSJ-39]MBU5430276.1 HAD family phosphatase [Kineothrix sp. MSJ-39]
MLQNSVQKIKAALFDMDGLLIDSERVYRDCWIQAACELGYAFDEKMALMLRSLDKELANALFIKWFDDATAYERVKTRRKEIMEEKVRKEPLQRKPGVHRLIRELGKREIKAAVVTASPQNRAQMHLSSVGLDGLFETIVTTEAVKRGKPFPDVYLYAAERLEVMPEDCLAFEDSPNGVKSAHAAGCHTVMIPDLTPVTEELMPYVEYTYGSLADLAGEMRKSII